MTTLDGNGLGGEPQGVALLDDGRTVQLMWSVGPPQTLNRYWLRDNCPAEGDRSSTSWSSPTHSRRRNRRPPSIHTPTTPTVTRPLA